MGDLLSLIEKAQETFDEQQALELQRKMSRNEFTLDDFLEQLRTIRNMGSMKDLMAMIPGMSGMLKGKDMDDRELVKVEAMICSMTRRERQNHNIINMSRQKRIARGSGTRPNDVNKLLKQFAQMRKMMKKVSRSGDPAKAMEMTQSLMGGGQQQQQGPPGGRFPF